MSTRLLKSLGMLSVMGLMAFSAAFGVSTVSHTDGKQGYVQSVATLVGEGARVVTDSVIGVPGTYALTSTGGVISIEQTDLDNVDTSVNNLLASIFEVLKLLPYIALIIGGFYLLDKLFGILPRPGGSSN